jgi:hypothetical protein
LHPRLKRPLSALREVGCEVLVRSEATCRDPDPAGADPVREMWDRPGSERNVDERIQLEDALALRFGIAAADGDHEIGPLSFSCSRVAQIRRKPCVGLLANRARVEHDDIRLVTRHGLTEAERLEHALDPLRVVSVHLTTKREM